MLSRSFLLTCPSNFHNLFCFITVVMCRCPVSLSTCAVLPVWNTVLTFQEPIRYFDFGPKSGRILRGVVIRPAPGWKPSPSSCGCAFFWSAVSVAIIYCDRVANPRTVCLSPVSRHDPQDEGVGLDFGRRQAMVARANESQKNCRKPL